MEHIVDFHLHSKYSRAVSRDMDLEHMSLWGVKKGIDVLASADFTHPQWFKELEKKLELDHLGLYMLKTKKEKTRFLLSTELSCIYSQGGKVRRIHVLIIFPLLSDVKKFNQTLESRGINLRSDGRPIMGMTAEELAEIAMTTSKDAIIIPAHIWTPWFSMFGSMSGFDSIKECFGRQAKHIHAIETGLSSDPGMNWRLSQLDKIQITSSSDAHSPRKMGREATVLELEKLSYTGIKEALESPKPKNHIAYTIEFYPEEGKYHFDGHRICKIRFSPEETKRAGGICPKCGKKLTVGVMNRVDVLADRKAGKQPEHRPGFKSIVPLQEIIANAFGVGDSSKRVQAEYENIISCLGNEFFVLLHAEKKALDTVCDPLVAEGIMRVREGKLHILPGYDGEYGTVEVFSEKERKPKTKQQSLL